jgi:hypothetical protein
MSTRPALFDFYAVQPGDELCFLDHVGLHPAIAKRQEPYTDPGILDCSIGWRVHSRFYRETGVHVQGHILGFIVNRPFQENEDFVRQLLHDMMSVMPDLWLDTNLAIEAVLGPTQEPYALLNPLAVNPCGFKRPPKLYLVHSR